MVRSWEARVSEYVDSERMRQRLKVGDQISCLIDGNYGTYRTQASLKEMSESTCSRPSDYYPCKHLDALMKTQSDRARFLDFDRTMAKDLAKMKRSEFVQLIRRIVLASPATLSALGVKGFETDDEKEDDYDS